MCSNKCLKKIKKQGLQQPVNQAKQQKCEKTYDFVETYTLVNPKNLLMSPNIFQGCQKCLWLSNKDKKNQDGFHLFN